MSEQIINNFYFGRAIYIVLIVLFAFSFINDLKKQDKINITKYLNMINLQIKCCTCYYKLSHKKTEKLISV